MRRVAAPRMSPRAYRETPFTRPVVRAVGPLTHWSVPGLNFAAVEASSPRAAPIRFCRTADGVNIAFGMGGKGWPLVKTPNWHNHVELDAHSPVWHAWIERMSRMHTLVRYDARGCGLSDREVGPASFATNRLDLEAVVDAAGLGQFALFGLSQGAGIAIEYAARHPERVSHLILCGAYLRGALKRADSPQAKEEVQTLLKIVELGWGRENSAFRQVFTSQFIPDSTLEQLRAFDEIQRRCHPRPLPACCPRSMKSMSPTLQPRCAARRWSCTREPTPASPSRRGGAWPARSPATSSFP